MLRHIINNLFTQIIGRSKITDELAKKTLLNYKTFSAIVVREQLSTVREVARRQADKKTRASNMCLLTNSELGLPFKTVIENVVWKDIMGKKEATDKLEHQSMENRRQQIDIRKPINSKVISGILKHTSVVSSSGANNADNTLAATGEFILNTAVDGTLVSRPDTAKRRMSVRLADDLDSKSSSS